MGVSIEPQSQSNVDDSLSPLKLLNRLITLLFVIVITYVLFLLAFGVLIVLGALGVIEPFGDASIIFATFKDFETLFQSIWTLIIPIITIVVIGMLIRWVFFTTQGGERTSQFSRILTDLPSLIAVVVILTICILAFLRSDEIPEPLGNIALVIVGFYFGRLRRNQATEEVEIRREEKKSDLI